MGLGLSKKHQDWGRKKKKKKKERRKGKNGGGEWSGEEKEKEYGACVSDEPKNPSTISGTQAPLFLIFFI